MYICYTSVRFPGYMTRLVRVSQTFMLLNIDARPPEWLPPPRSKPARSSVLAGTADLLKQIKSGTVEVPAAPPTWSKTKLQLQKAQRTAETVKQQTELSRQIVNWNPSKDPRISGDAQSTVFLARLPYTATEPQIRAQFETYGSIASVRIVEPQKKYAFLLFQDASSAVRAVQETAGMLLFHGRRIIVDLERGRTQPNWKPRRLGGGMGGRLSAARQRAEVARSTEIMKRGVRLPSQEIPANKRKPGKPTPYDRNSHARNARSTERHNDRSNYEKPSYGRPNYGSSYERSNYERPIYERPNYERNVRSYDQPNYERNSAQSFERPPGRRDARFNGERRNDERKKPSGNNNNVHGRTLRQY